MEGGVDAVPAAVPPTADALVTGEAGTGSGDGGGNWVRSVWGCSSFS